MGIIDKAKKLGLDIGDGTESLDNLRAIASQVGFSDFESLDDASKLDSILSEQLSSDTNDNVENLDSDALENNPVRNERFGDKQYNAALDKNGKFDKNYYDNKQQELDKKRDESKKELGNENKKAGEDEDGNDTYKKKNWLDKQQDKANYYKNNINSAKNRVDKRIANVRRGLNAIEDPLGTASNAIKDKVKENVDKKVDEKLKKPVQDAGKQAAKKTGDAAKAAGKQVGKVAAQAGAKLAAFVAANPWILLVIGGVALFFVIIVAIMGGDDESGYYSQECDFNSSTVVLASCETEESQNLSIEDYVIGTTYSLLKDGEYSDEVIQAVMIVVKTNALSYGSYNSADKILNLDDCVYSYEEVSDSNYEELYSTISDYLYVSSSYTNAISNMGASSILNIDSSVIEGMSQIEGSYSDILRNVYVGDETVVGEYRDSLFIGDSRMKGMILAGAVSDANAIYGTGYGYDWLVGNGTFDSSFTNSTSGGINGINSKIISGKSYNIVTWLGVNDLSYVSANEYYEKYYELASGEWSNHNIYVVSVGPVNENSSISNDDINNFNESMKRLIIGSNLSNLKFIDVNYEISSFDNEGVHYGTSDYKNIYSIIQNSLDNSLNGDYKLYNLSEHCTYYTLTDNEAYWWPIGSKEATSGNIYGATPTTTRITSTFGPRTIEGISGNHGAIDIGGTCNGDVIIASKDGVVKTVSNSCDNNGYYQNPCGGGLGNYVIIEHSDGTESRYGHMYPDSITVSVGDSVVQGQKIGMLGNSGSSTGCHLHYEMRINNVKVDPLKYVDPDNPRPIVNSSVNIIATGDEGGKENVCRSLLASNFSNNAVAGIMVNMAAESSFRTNAVEYGSGYTIETIYDAPSTVAAGFGLVQWSYGRRINVINYANEKGLSPTSLQAQLEYLNEEIQNKYPLTKKYIFGNYSAYEIGLTFCKNFEVPKNYETTCPNRVSQSIDSYLNYVNNGCS